MKKLLRFLALFAILFLFVGGINLIVRVYMTGWQFIILVLVLAGIADFFVERRL